MLYNHTFIIIYIKVTKLSDRRLLRL